MVYAFFIQTVGSKDVQVLYYKFFSCYGTENEMFSEKGVGKSYESSANVQDSENSGNIKALFETITEKKELLSVVSNKVHMHYSLKMKQSLIPLSSVESDMKITGVYTERHWKPTFEENFVVVWQGVRGLGFTLLCKKNENLHQAQNILDTLITQLEKQLKFLSDPLVAIKLIETVSLIVNSYIPGGQLIYMNSKMLKAFEKNVEVDLYAK